jgi:hypothetical protein
LHIALTLVFWTSTLKKSPLFLDFILDFIVLEAYIIRIFVLACKLVDFWRSKVDIYFMPKTLYKLMLMLANLQLAYHFYTTQYHPNPSQKPCKNRTIPFLLQIRPFYAEQLLSSCDFTEYYSITLSLAILAYPVL